MNNLSKVLLIAAPLTLAIGCSSSDSTDEVIDDVLNKSTVNLSDLDEHAVTYQDASNQVSHTDIYCPSGMLGDPVGKDGNWTVAGNDLVVNNTTSGVALTYTTTNARLDKDASYLATGGATFKVTKISETVCL